MNKWQLVLENETITITEERENYFTIHTTDRRDTDTNSLWFSSYQSARNYVRNEMLAEGRFKKVNIKEKISKGHVLTEDQAETINEMLEYMKSLHEIYDDEDASMMDTLDGFVDKSENLLVELGLVNRKIF